jgi:ABC-type uncharacterized transport system substrate-binding protein
LDDLAFKQISVVLDIAPKVRNFGLVSSGGRGDLDPDQKLASRGIRFQRLQLDAPEQVEPLLARFKDQGGEAVIIEANQITGRSRDQIARVAKSLSLITVAESPEFVQAGCLMTYTAPREDVEPMMAEQAQAILRGADPSSIPFRLPSRFKLLLNAKTASEIKLDVPTSFYAQVDELLD